MRRFVIAIPFVSEELLSRLCVEDRATWLRPAIITFFLIPFIIHHLGDRLYGFWVPCQWFHWLLRPPRSRAWRCRRSVCVRSHRTGGYSRVPRNFQYGAAYSVVDGWSRVACDAAALAAATPLFSRNPQDASLFCKVITHHGL